MCVRRFVVYKCYLCFDYRVLGSKINALNNILGPPGSRGTFVTSTSAFRHNESTNPLTPFSSPSSSVNLGSISTSKSAAHIISSAELGGGCSAKNTLLGTEKIDTTTLP